MTEISFSPLWLETLERVKRNRDILLPVAGAFLFLPQLVFSRVIGDVLPSDILKGEHSLGIFGLLVGLLLVSTFGQLIVCSVITRDGTNGMTLGQVMKLALVLLPAGIALSMMQGLAVGFGLIFLILPGIYLMARLVVGLPLLARLQGDPMQALRASWRLTNGYVLRIVGMVSMLVLGFLLLSLCISGLGAAIGVVSTVVAGQPAEGWGIGRWLYEAILSWASAAMGLIYMSFVSVLSCALISAARDKG